MGEDIHLRPAGEIEQRPVRKEVETGLGKTRSAFALKPLVELLPQPMKIADVAGGIVLFRVGQLRRAPVGSLLLLLILLPKPLPHHLLHAIPFCLLSFFARGPLVSFFFLPLPSHLCPFLSPFLP